MSICSKYASRCAPDRRCMAFGTSRTCFAQAVEADAKAAAKTAVREAEATEHDSTSGPNPLAFRTDLAI